LIGEGAAQPATSILTVDMTADHWDDVARIYADGMATGNATFETTVPSWDAWDRSHLPEHRFVALIGDQVVDWVAASAVSDRCVYDGVIENSVYVDASVRGQGVGRIFVGASDRVERGGGCLDDLDGDLPGARVEHPLA
jgi:L-amino acid N-acyltransferase YncA